MTEPTPRAQATGAAEAPATSAPDSSVGHPVVDEVLSSLGTLDGRPVDEHAAVFEAAHERLRAALHVATGSSGSSGS